MKLTIKTLQGKQLPIEIESDWTVSLLKIQQSSNKLITYNLNYFAFEYSENSNHFRYAFKNNS